MTQSDPPADARTPAHPQLRAAPGRTTPAQARFRRALAAVAHLPVARPRAISTPCSAATQPRVLEIGFGNGEQLAWSAAHEPALDFLGVEVHRPGGRLINALAAQDASNVRVYHHDAVEVLEREIAPQSLAQVRISRPWHKKRHNKRRLIQPEFVAPARSRVAHGGLLHLATDWADYAEHMVAVLEASPLWRNRAGAGSSRPPGVAHPDALREARPAPRARRVGSAL